MINTFNTKFKHFHIQKKITQKLYLTLVNFEHINNINNRLTLIWAADVKQSTKQQRQNVYTICRQLQERAANEPAGNKPRLLYFPSKEEGGKGGPRS